MSKQHEWWDREHSTSQAIASLDHVKMSQAVERFYTWLCENNAAKRTGISIGCGKGRNEIGLAQHGIEMHCLDFSHVAITEASMRASTQIPRPSVHFYHQDITQPWGIDNYFDIGLDCFALADVESYDGRYFAAQQVVRKLQPGGHLLVYTLSPEDEYSQEMLSRFPGRERNCYYPPSGKFEKCFDFHELKALYKGLKPIVCERIEKTAEYDGRTYTCNHHWVIFQKPRLSQCPPHELRAPLV